MEIKVSESYYNTPLRTISHIKIIFRVGNKYVFVFKYTNNPVFVFVFEVLKIYIFVFDHCIWLYLIKYRSVLKMFFFSDLKFDKGSWYLFCLNKIELDSNKTDPLAFNSNPVLNVTFHYLPFSDHTFSYCRDIILGSRTQGQLNFFFNKCICICI